MNREEYRKQFQVGKDCLDPEMKRIRIETKARILEGCPITDDDILDEAILRVD